MGQAPFQLCNQTFTQQYKVAVVFLGMSRNSLLGKQPLNPWKTTHIWLYLSEQTNIVNPPASVREVLQEPVPAHSADIHPPCTVIPPPWESTCPDFVQVMISKGTPEISSCCAFTIQTRSTDVSCVSLLKNTSQSFSHTHFDCFLQSEVVHLISLSGPDFLTMDYLKLDKHWSVLWLLSSICTDQISQILFFSCVIHYHQREDTLANSDSCKFPFLLC